jgi:hypothetical protein
MRTGLWLRSVAIATCWIAAASTLSCGTSDDDLKVAGHAAPKAATETPGALVAVSVSSQVGVLLDELPDSIRDRAADALLAKNDAFWIARAKRQLALASYRLNFRASFYDEADMKQQLPLPPEESWKIEVDGHDYVLVYYTLSSTLVTDAASPKASEPALAKVGGTWDEPFVFPVDPELLLQRTGYACMDEAEFPPNSVDSEDVEFFYDQECDIEPELSTDGCHLTQPGMQSCTDALKLYVGKIETAVHFERIAWSDELADKARVGTISNDSGADLDVLGEELEVNRLTYRYVPADSCAIAEKCVGGPGFRRLLQFNASEKNTGAKPLDIGDVDYFLDDPKHPTPNANHHLYEYSPCHEHYHFSHYAKFTYGGDDTLGSKRAFCLESVQRYGNNEHSPLWSPYGDCSYQGISEGWGDQYNAGIECQWIDVTSIDTSGKPVTKPLGVRSNPDGFLCEGTPVVDDNGDLEWEPTKFKNDDGEVVDRPKCDYMPGWDDNNYDERDVILPLPGEGMVTAACTRGQIGRHRNCGFNYDHEVQACTAGKKVTLSCSVPDKSAPQVVRVCEASKQLGAGVACVDADALGTTEVESGSAITVTFDCPSKRDADEPGGGYALYMAPSFTEDAAAKVTCTPQ